jgi:hypothetical protein
MRHSEATHSFNRALNAHTRPKKKQPAGNCQPLCLRDAVSGSINNKMGLLYSIQASYPAFPPLNILLIWPLRRRSRSKCFQVSDAEISSTKGKERWKHLGCDR